MEFFKPERQQLAMFDDTPVSLPGRKKKPRKAPANVVKVNHIIANKRYYYRRLLKDRYEMNTTKRTIEVPYETFEAIPMGDRYYIGQLIRFGYNMQFKLIQDAEL